MRIQMQQRQSKSTWQETNFCLRTDGLKESKEIQCEEAAGIKGVTKMPA